MRAPGGTVTEALVLRVVPYGESSQVVHLATPEHGLVAALAKGACRPDSEVQGGLSTLAFGEATLRPPGPRAGEEGLALLLRFRQRDLWRGLARSPERYRAAAYVLELLRLWMRPHLPLPALYRAGVTALRAIAGAAPEGVAAWSVWFEARAVAATGHRPLLEACAGCGGPLSGALSFSPPAGGAVHRRCAPTGPSLPLSAALHGVLVRLYTQRLEAFVAEGPAPREVEAVGRLHAAWIPWILERRLASREGGSG